MYAYSTRDETDKKINKRRTKTSDPLLHWDLGTVHADAVDAGEILVPPVVRELNDNSTRIDLERLVFLVDLEGLGMRRGTDVVLE